MLKILILMLSFTFTSVILSWTTDVNLPSKVEKRMDKQLKKHFRTKNYIKNQIDISAYIHNETSTYSYEVINQKSSDTCFLIINVANGCKIGGCDINNSGGKQFEKFYIYSLYNTSGTLLDLHILDYQSDYGFMVTSRWWLKQFVKKSSETYKYNKNIDALSGATKSVQSVIQEMNQNKTLIEKLTKGRFNAESDSSQNKPLSLKK